MGLFKRKIKNAFDIARDIGVDEKKVKELVNGEREIRGETMDKVLKSINKSKVERDLEKLNIFEWYKNTDLKKLREEFGYKKQVHLARALKIDNGELNRFENKKFDKVNNMIIKMYDFYHNDFNKNIEKSKPIIDIITSNKDDTISRLEEYENAKEKDITGKSKKVGRPKKDITNESKKVGKEEKKEILDWYLNTDLIKLRGDKPQYELAQESGIVQGSLSDLELHKIHGCSKNVIKLYNYYQNLEKTNLYNSENEKSGQNKEDIVWKWYNEIKDLRAYGREFGYTKNKLMAILNLSYDQIRDFEGHHYKSATPIVCKIYDFYHNEENRLPAIEWEKPKKKEEIKENIEDDAILTTNTYGNCKTYKVQMPSNVTHINSPLTGSNDLIGKQIVVPYYHIIEDEPCEDNSLEKENERLKETVKKQEEKIFRLERQIMLYEKLIEKM